MIHIAVLASGRGSNFQAIINGVKEGDINGKIEVLITDNPDAKAIERAKKNKIPFEVVERKNFKERIEMDQRIKAILDSHNIDLVVLAGYMRIIKSKELLASYKNKIINIHPSLLPSFGGNTTAQKDAFDYGCKISGLTIHFVTLDVDAGPIIYQEAVDISDCRDETEVSLKILKHENKAYRKVVADFSKGTYVIKEGRRTQFIHFPIKKH